MKKYLLLFLTLNIVTFSIELTLDKSIDLAKKKQPTTQRKKYYCKTKKIK